MLRLSDQRPRFLQDNLIQDVTGDPDTRDTELEERIQREIMQCTWGRIRRLRVEARNGSLMVEGVTTSYYVKQLAIKAMMDVVATLARAPSIVVEISLDDGLIRQGSYYR